VFRYLLYRTGERSRAEELTGDVFLRVLENIKDFRLGRSDQALALTGWIYRIAHNLLVDDYRRQKAKGIAEPLPDEVDDSRLAHDPEEWHLRRADLQMAMLRLTDEQQTVVLFRFQDGLTSLEISKILGKTETAVKALQRRALRTLARLLASQTETESERGNIAGREGAGRPGR
ncbi:MAG: RNA polymerase sigma factor, partial [Rudaea sp.]